MKHEHTDVKERSSEGRRGRGKSDQKERVALRAVSSWAVVEQMSPDAERITPECFAILGAAKRHFCQVRDGREEN